jgi:hypothetical protein
MKSISWLISGLVAGVIGVADRRRRRRGMSYRTTGPAEASLL